MKHNQSQEHGHRLPQGQQGLRRLQREKREDTGTNRDITVGVAGFSLTGDTSQGSSLGDKNTWAMSHPLPRWLCV